MGQNGYLHCLCLPVPLSSCTLKKIMLFSARFEFLSASEIVELHQKRGPSVSMLQLPGEIPIEKGVGKSYGRDQTYNTSASQIHVGSATVRVLLFFSSVVLSA